MTKPLHAFMTTIFLAMLIPGLALAHNVFATLTEIEWNKRDNSLEVIMQMHAEILEARLSLDLGERLNFMNEDQSAKLEAAAGPLILDHLQILVDGAPIQLTYLGLEYQDQEVFLYMETDLAEAPATLEVMNSLFLEDLPGQINSVIATVKDVRQAGEIVSGSDPLLFQFD